MWLTIIHGFALLAASYALALRYGRWRWQKGTQLLRSRMEAARLPPQPARVDFRELDALPAPVAAYFRTVLQDGQPMVAGARVRHGGSFNLGQSADQWKPFTSDQQVLTRRPAFDWDARIRLTPGLQVHVHDAYVAGEGLLRATLVGLIPLASLKGRGALAEGELMRYFAEAAWYPTALLPSQGVRWQAVDAHSALGTLVDGQISVTMLFSFNDQNMIEAVSAEARGRTVKGKLIPTPWRGRFWRYGQRDNMQVPLEAEVAWLLPDGAQPYWRGRIEKVAYEFAQ